MAPGVDVLAEGVRLAGATLMVTALMLTLLDERPRLPMTVALAGGALLALGSGALLIATVAPFAGRVGEPLLPLALEYLEDTRHGPSLLLPLLPATWALLLMHMLGEITNRGLRLVVFWLLGITLLAIPALMAMGGHTATTRWEHAAMVLQILHMAAGIGWVALVLSLLPRVVRRQPLAPILQKLGNIAGALVLILVPSGVVTAWQHGAPPPWSRQEPYELLLLLKLGALAIALAAAGLNRLAVQGKRASGEAGMRRSLWLETCVLLLVVALASWLARTPPPA